MKKAHVNAKKDKQFRQPKQAQRRSEAVENPLKEFYSLMLEYGTPKTKQQILQMDLSFTK
ncbi:hypothetical protein [Paenibacillus gansuensis]|uniref:Uncharacterized protein n=1 Tax=Paenibacillus gansuensis TaxID=306542 RepID=A0ABW5PCB4_9BACL